jgi:hypothetical protein
VRRRISSILALLLLVVGCIFLTAGPASAGAYCSHNNHYHGFYPYLSPRFVHRGHYAVNGGFNEVFDEQSLGITGWHHVRQHHVYCWY